ncbi:MAG: phosphodiesterase [Pseudomonas sp.]|nr:phosphodiesterase [Pseudomonas sp.]
MKHYLPFTALLYFGALTSTCVQADVLRIPLSQQGSASIKMPAHGDQQAQVVKQFGEPKVRHSSVGQPPISRWDYPGFSVYFEQNTVVNSVQTHQPNSSSAP